MVYPVFVAAILALISTQCILALKPSAATANANNMNLQHPYPTKEIFLEKCARRLGYEDESYLLDAKPSMSLLCELQERHLCHVPFENLSQHGAAGGPVVLDLVNCRPPRSMREPKHNAAGRW